MLGQNPVEGGRGDGPTQSRAAPLDPGSLSVHVRHSPNHPLTPAPAFKFKPPDLTPQASAQWRGLFKTPSVFRIALSSFPGETPVVQRLILSKGCISTNLQDLPGGLWRKPRGVEKKLDCSSSFGTRRIPNTLYSLVLKLKLYTPQVPS